MIKKKITIISLIILSSLVLISITNFTHDLDESSSFKADTEQLKASSSPVNGKSLMVNQYANISKSIAGSTSFPQNVSFNLAPGWTSKNTTINYEGVAQKKDWVTNGTFDSTLDMSAWTYYESGDYWQGSGFKSNAAWIKSQSQMGEGDIAYFEQNISIPEEFDSGEAKFSADVKMAFSTGRFNGCLFISLTIENIEINNTAYAETMNIGDFIPLGITYDPTTYGHILPNTATLRFGVYGYSDDTYSSWQDFYFDNIKYEPWTKPNISNIIIVNDNEFNQNYTYISTDYGEGYSFIDVERYRSVSDSIIFTIYQNLSDVIDFKIESFYISSAAIKMFNTSILGTPGSLYTLGANITWQVDFSITSIPDGYTSWIEIEKPSDWVFIHVIDGFEAEQIGSCTGTEFGSNRLKIPSSILTYGLYKLEAISDNYIAEGNMALWNQFQFVNASKFTYGSIFQVIITLDNSVTLPNTKINTTIYFPNNTIFLQKSETPSFHNIKIGNYTIGKNMSIGKYRVEVVWTDNQSYLEREKIGYLELAFSIWHHTNLTAVDTDFEKIKGDPLLLKIKYSDYDINESIHFADVTYNSTFGTSGTMAYFGSGEYFVDVDTSSLSLGDYYFSFNASEVFYENQTKINLIHLKIVAEPLALEVPHTALEGTANSIISCKINTTGAIGGTKVFPANISTDWFNPYNITDHNNGTYTLDFSTEDIPTSGFLESFNIEIFANKTYYGSTNEFITLLVHPLSTVASVNNSLVSINSNEIVNLKVNYTIEGSSDLIMDSNCSVEWQGSSLITPVSDGFNIQLITIGLPVDYYTALIKLEKVGFEDAFESVTIIINEQDVNMTVSINSGVITENTLIDSYFQQTINVSVRAYAVIDKEFLSGGTITLKSNNYQKNLTEIPSTYFFTAVILDGVNFTSGINNLFLRFEQANYTSKIFSFQLFLSTQDVNLTVSLNSEELIANSLIESHFQQEINISVRAYAIMDQEFLSGGTVTLISNMYQNNFTEILSTNYSISLILDGVNFISGINNFFIRFEQANYTTNIFPFQLFINTQNVNLTAQINNQEVHEGYLLEVSFNQEFKISCRAFADIEGVFLSGGNITFVNGDYEVELVENADYWFNQTILASTSFFTIGPNYVYFRFQQHNYTISTFVFQVFVDQVEINVDTLDFEGLISGTPGESILIRLNLTEAGSLNYIDNATVFYSWNFGAGYFSYVGNGIYETEVSLPSGFEGNYNFEIIISKEGILYKTKEFAFIIDINPIEGPNFLIWIIIIGLVAVIGILGVLSLRSYVILPRRREREAELMSKIQVFKDTWNIRAVILIQRDSGLPVYSEEISMDKDQDSFLISGFIQAITAFSETFVEKEFKGAIKLATEYEYLRTIIDLDFKFFQLLVCDYETVRVLLVLREEASELLKKQLYLLAVSINSQFSEELRAFSGNVNAISKELGDLLNQFLFLHYNRPFEVTPNRNYLDSVLESSEITKLERRLVNVISSMTKINKMFTLRAVIDLIEEKNEDLVLEALNSLILRKVIISPYSSVIKSKNGDNSKKTSVKKK